MPDDVSIDIALEDEDPVAIRLLLEETGAEQITQVREKGLAGIGEGLFAIMGLQALANLIIRLLPLTKPGVVVDTRGSKVRIRKDANLPRGNVLVITKTGVRSTLYQPQAVEVSNLLKAGASE